MAAKKRPRVVHSPTLSHLTHYYQTKKIKEMASEVKIYNMYDKLENVPSLEELKKENKKTAKQIIEVAREKHTNKELMKYWNISGYHMYKKLYPKYDVDTNKEKVRKRAKTISKQEKETITKVSPKQESPKAKITKPSGWKIDLGGVFNGEEVTERILGLDSILSKEKEYKILMTIEEV